MSTEDSPVRAVPESGTVLVVGYDGTQTSQDALAWAVAEARLRGGSVRAIYAVPPFAETVTPFGGSIGPDFAAAEQAGEQVLASAVAQAQRLAPGVVVDTRVVHACAADALLGSSDAESMVVVGSRGHGGIAHLLVGSTGVQLANHANCPVVIIRPAATGPAAPAGSGAGRIVVGVDGSAAADQAVRFALTEASVRGVGVTAVDAWKKPPPGLPPTSGDLPPFVVADEMEGTQTRLLSDSLAAVSAQFPGVDLRQEVAHDDPVQALVSRSQDAVMLVVGSLGHGRFSSLLPGSVGHGVLHHARCPVVIVRRPNQ
jgi:nucleotide-binding universal stress UspA family protein